MTTFEEKRSQGVKATQGASAPRTKPAAVVQDATMTVDEKRSTLASWASDLRAVPGRPALRRLDDGCLVEIDDVLEALKQLDGSSSGSKSAARSEWDYWPGLGRLSRRGRDDDDDPPTPAPAAIRPWSPILEGGAAVAA